MASCPQTLYNNHIDKIQKNQLCSMTEDLTPTIQSSQEIKFESSIVLALPSKIWSFRSFQVLHKIAKGINFQTPTTHLFFNLLLHTTKTSLMVWGCTQLTPIKERDKCHQAEIHWRWTKRQSTNSSYPQHMGHLLTNLKSLRIMTTMMLLFIYFWWPRVPKC